MRFQLLRTLNNKLVNNLTNRIIDDAAVFSDSAISSSPSTDGIRTIVDKK